MQQLRVILVYGVILAAVVYGAIKAYIYFSVTGELDEVIARVRPFAQISYDGVSSSLDGSIEVKGIEVRSAEQPLPLRIGALRLQGPGMGFLFDVAGGFSNGKIPTNLQLGLRRMEVPDIQQMVPAMLPSNAGLLEPLPDPCGLGGVMRSAGMLQSNSYPLLLDMDMGYQLDIPGRVGRFQLGYHVLGGGSLSMDTRLSGLSVPGSLVMGVVPAVEQLKLRYTPNGEYMKTHIEECAKKQGISESIYIEGLLTQPAGRLVKEIGFAPGSGLRHGLVQFLMNPGELLVTAGPIEDPALLQNGQIPPERLVKYLNLELTVNGTPVNDLSFTTEAGGSGRRGAAGAESEDQEKKPKRRAHYVETPVAELGSYLGRPVQISIAGHDKPQSGVLVAVRKTELDVEKRMRQGKMSLHVSFEDIKGIKVLRYTDKEE